MPLPKSRGLASAEFTVVRLGSGVCIDDIHDETAVVGLAASDCDDTEAEEAVAGARLREFEV
jgi:hypothetical protein